MKITQRMSDTTLINLPDSYEKYAALTVRALKLGRHYAVQDEIERMDRETDNYYKKENTRRMLAVIEKMEKNKKNRCS